MPQSAQKISGEIEAEGVRPETRGSDPIGGFMTEESCLFCRMIRKEIKAKVEYEDDRMLVIHDINPQAPAHLLVIPKKHVETIDTLQAPDVPMMGDIIYCAKKVAQKNGWKHYRLVFNNGAESGQSVFHIHLHLLAGRRMSWPPG